MKVWFAKKRKDKTVALTRYEAIDLLCAIHQDLLENRYGSAMEKIGMDPELFGPEQTLDELAEVFMVRLVDLQRYAGVIITEVKE